MGHSALCPNPKKESNQWCTFEWNVILRSGIFDVLKWHDIWPLIIMIFDYYYYAPYLNAEYLMHILTIKANLRSEQQIVMIWKCALKENCLKL